MSSTKNKPLALALMVFKKPNVQLNNKGDKVIKGKRLFFLPDPRGAGLQEAFQFPSVRLHFV